MATFSLISQSLRTGEPIPQAMHHNLLDRLAYHGHVARQGWTKSGDADGGEHPMHGKHVEYVYKYEFMFYATAICAVFQILEGLNELRDITAHLCGEIPLQGFDQWRDEYDSKHSVKSSP